MLNTTMIFSFQTAVRLSDKISFCASIACTSVLILMFVKPPKSIGNYRYCYYILSSFESISAISHFLGAPSFYVNNNTYLAFSAHGSLIAHVFWIAAFHAFELWLLGCFVYRYATVCRNYHILDILSTKGSFAVVFSVITANHLVATFTFYLMFYPSQALREKASLLLLDEFHLPLTGVVGFDYDIGPVFVSSGAVQLICVIGNIISISTMITIVACALLISNYIKANSFSAIQTKQHYRVLLYLGLQAFVPFCFVYSLALIFQMVIVIRVDISFLAPIFTLTTSIPPLVGALSVIGLTNEYRKMFVSGIRRTWGTKTSTIVQSKDTEMQTVSHVPSSPMKDRKR